MDKKISIFVEAVVAGAKQKLQEVSNELGKLGKTTTSTASEVSGGMGRMGQAATVLQGAMMAMAGAVIAKLAQMGVQWVNETARMAASNIDLEKSYENLSARYSLASEELLTALDKAAKGTVNKFALMLEANKAMRLGVATTVEEFEDLMKIAVVRAKEFGLTTQQAWGYLVTAIGRASPMIADNIGILLDANATYEEYARSIGKSADELTKLEQKEAIRNRILQEGIPDMEAWNEMGVTASDVFQQYDATMAELRQELGELFLPVVLDVTEALTDLAHIAQGEVVDAHEAQREAVYKTAASYDELYRRMSNVANLQRPGGRWTREGTKDMQELGITTEGAALANEALRRSYKDIDMKLQDARRSTQDFGDVTEDTTRDQEELDKALQKGADIWADYGRKVEEANYQFARKVEDAQFRATQAIENAAFRRYEIERNAAERRGDLLTQYDIRLEADTATHYNRLRYMRQDLLDELADMEYDYQQEVADLMKRAPWWVRQALQKEFTERERIVKSGDKAALAEYDKALRERIRAIDPVYAKELDLLDEQYQHKKDVEQREAGQAQQRQKEDWSIRFREQERSLREQLNSLDRNLSNQLNAWQFHEAQREEAERRSMGRMHDDHDHTLAAMYENTMRRLSEITPLWEYYGKEWAMALIRGMATGQMYTPVTPGYEPDWTNPFAPGGTYGAAAPAAAGAMTNINIDVNVGGGYTPYQAQELATTLGQEIRRQTR